MDYFEKSVSIKYRAVMTSTQLHENAQHFTEEYTDCDWLILKIQPTKSFLVK